ncbi:MAG: dienelactone hydrolase [gamma proteobacterium symbiont of Ctena orbiculata]|uniref:Dienelactone hydrolase family protein n=1 Tax=Candidatus Thiodiazotropha taylori TaxID=2792791 RepID=A0A944QT53_9GAMM|nr:dienelactone hydrolase family protein [Candidatus Thiodiazotropha taylori]PUB88393.1 MAG: dienelactone hydrolase [gamma proteobacterium symbiont of Ctena orbiculata]MBT2987365.1 dienelactone hydrolase family protein [Candidatus Thiodiazotropha taylori]MBT3001840.1 dienelactone hydrolase family protein [Candidatus Thiodiazotropha taylori]MBT3028584.1 dienelactone hydrolase family protein [Candidatus Thiodiazotropha taylori]
MNKLVMALVLCSFPLTLLSAVVGEEVGYNHGGIQMKGFLAYDDAASERRPGILVVHEWWGHNEYARDRARQLAAMGYTALAVDMYGDGKQADHPKDAGRFAAEVKKNMETATARFQAAMELLQAHKSVAKNDISAIGYCFGGGMVLEMARRGLDLDLVGSFHGSLPTSHPAVEGAVKAEVLVFNGADDPFVKPEHIDAFMAEMDRAGVKYSFTNYPGAKHSFTNPGADNFGKAFDLPLKYDEAADRQSWAALAKALKAHYGN